MFDTVYCPICSVKLSSQKYQLTKLVHTNKRAYYIKRSCSHCDHNLFFFADKITRKVDWIQFTPTEDPSVFVEVDFVNEVSRIKSYANASEIMNLEIDEAIVPDFPTLDNLNEKINTLITFS